MSSVASYQFTVPNNDSRLINMADPLQDKQIVLGVCGGIAAYKAAAFVRLLVTAGAKVRVIMTEAAQAFVGPVTFQALSGNPVWTRMFHGGENGSFRHITWAEQADGVVIIPATANVVGKMAQGIADDPLTTFILGVKAPILVCPSMNVRMFENAVVQANLNGLRKAGMRIIGPVSGSLACGQEGTGRLAELETILEALRCALVPQDMAGERVLVTAGPTQEAFDPVRFVTNPSSGKMGFALARTARRRGAEVVLVSGPTMFSDPDGIKTIRVKTAEAMFHAVMEEADRATAIVKAAAVSDWRPAEVSNHKMKKDKLGQQCLFERTDDILETLGKKKNNTILVGFAAETENLEKNARAKVAAKNLDLIVANLVGKDASGFGSDTNQASLLYKDGRTENLPLMEKASLADLLWDKVLEIRKGQMLDA
jgi:phosphopantothenoylcysteine decarboxylase/phosphopantothenate--cysteine ligase